MTTDTFRQLSAIIYPYKYAQRHSNEGLWRRVLEANQKQVPLKSYSLKTRIDSANQILSNKEKVT